MTDGSTGSAHGVRQGRSWFTAGWVAMGRGLAMFGLGLLAVFLAWFALTAMSLVLMGVGLFLVPPTVAAVRWSAQAQRRMTAASGVEVASPYRAAPPARGGWLGARRRCEALFTDSSTWRDLLWAQVAVTVGGLLAIIPFGMLAHGVFGLLLPLIWEPVVTAWDGSWYLFIPLRDHDDAVMAAVLGFVEIPVGLFVAPYVLRLHARLTHSLLAPTRQSPTAARVRRPAGPGTDGVDAPGAGIGRG
ncbi:sensor domain-containing protein [Streptomyces mauvecolor]|uniref:Sensor domain-containing protein n=1 Tax=Streptomyces mauvecolor TaxID=58345 RepID=A0ABV9UWT4_9ACTN